MGIYFGESVYGVRCIDKSNNNVLYESIKETKYSGEDINQILQFVNTTSKSFDIYFYKSYSTTYNLHNKPAFMWVKTDFNLSVQQN